MPDSSNRHEFFHAGMTQFKHGGKFGFVYHDRYTKIEKCTGSHWFAILKKQPDGCSVASLKVISQ